MKTQNDSLTETFAFRFCVAVFIMAAWIWVHYLLG